MDFVHEESLKAKYQVKDNIFVTCSLDVIEATATGLKTQIGIRMPGDVFIPPGTRLYIISGTSSQTSSKGEQERFYVVSQGIEVMDGVPVMACSPITRETIPNRRKQERLACQFSARMDDLGQLKFTATLGSTLGLTLICHPSKRLIGLVVGKQQELQVRYKDRDYPFSTEITHIHYDWQKCRHSVGVKFKDLTEQQEVIIKRLIDPEYTVEISQTALVDPEQARIVPD